MRSLIKLFVLNSLVFLLIPAQAMDSISTGAVTKQKMPSEYKKTEKYSKFDLQLGINGGFDSNPVQLPSGNEVNANFYQLKPQVSYDRELARDLFLITNLEGDYKDYDDKVVSSVKSALKVQLDVGLSYFFNPRHEIGLTTSGLLNKSSGLNFTSNGLDTKGRSIDYFQFFNEVYYSYNRERFNVELSANVVNNINDSFVQDDVADSNGQFAEFKDDFDQTGLKLKLNYKLSDDSNVYIEPSYSRRSYLERAARFSEGSTGQAVNPKLIERHQGVGLGYKYDDSFVSSEVKALFVQERDLVFKANDATSYGVEGKLSVPIASLFKAGAEYSISKRDYDNFVTNPQQNPTSGSLRNDTTQAWGISASKQYGRTDIEIKYNALNKDSNYKPFGSNIGSQYNEDIVTLGLNIRL